MSIPTLDLAPTPAAEAVAANLRRCFASFAHLPGATWRQDERIFVASTESPVQFFNGMVGGRFAGPDEAIDAALLAVQEPLRERGVAYRWWLTPGHAPADLAARLLRQGLHLQWEAPGMALDLRQLAEVPLPAEVEIARVTDVAGLDRWLGTFAAGFDIPQPAAAWWRRAFLPFVARTESPWRWYLGTLAGQPVATVAMLMADGIAGIYHVVTLPEARRRGIGAAVTRAPLVAARELGCKVAVLQASDEGFPVYLRLGFAEVCRLPMVAWQPPGVAG